ncbi:MAG TPA: hypothetical protein VFY10_06605 [Dehalococcoidia bacterium]|nr:hypothetical protein [Dehalococcoidia bacterium]
MVSFNAYDYARVAAGQITVTWRLWKYAHVKAGNVYATGFGGAVSVDDVRRIKVRDVTDADAHEVGLPDAQALIELARSHTGAIVSPDTELYCVRFHYLDAAPEKPRLSLDEIGRRLERLDARSPAGPWTLATLRLIEDNPGVVSTALAAQFGRPRLEFKAEVRKLKALGLTISLVVGYELSELGQTYLDSLGDESNGC